MTKIIRIYAITNPKAGSGKTTTAVNLASTLAKEGKRVLVVDLDPKANASRWLRINDDGAALLEALTGDPTIAADRLFLLLQPSHFSSYVHVIPSGPEMVKAEERLSALGLWSSGRLRRALVDMCRRIWDIGWDVILLDCPSTLGWVTINALNAAKAVLVPVKTDIMSADDMSSLLDQLEQVRLKPNRRLPVACVLATCINRGGRHPFDAVARIRERFGDMVFQAVIRESTHLAEAMACGEPLTVYAPKSHSAKDYRAVAMEFLGREGIE